MRLLMQGEIRQQNIERLKEESVQGLFTPKINKNLYSHVSSSGLAKCVNNGSRSKYRTPRNQKDTVASPNYQDKEQNTTIKYFDSADQRKRENYHEQQDRAGDIYMEDYVLNKVEEQEDKKLTRQPKIKQGEMMNTNNMVLRMNNEKFKTEGNCQIKQDDDDDDIKKLQSGESKIRHISPFINDIEKVRRRRNSSYNREIDQKLNNLLFQGNKNRSRSKSRPNSRRSNTKKNHNEKNQHFYETKKQDISNISHYVEDVTDISDLNHFQYIEDKLTKEPIYKNKNFNQNSSQEKKSNKSNSINKNYSVISHDERVQNKLMMSFKKQNMNMSSSKHSQKKSSKKVASKPIKEEMQNNSSFIFLNAHIKSSLKTSQMLERTDSLTRNVLTNKRDDSLEQSVNTGKTSNSNKAVVIKHKQREERFLDSEEIEQTDKSKKSRGGKNSKSSKKEILGQLKEMINGSISGLSVSQE